MVSNFNNVKIFRFNFFFFNNYLRFSYNNINTKSLSNIASIQNTSNNLDFYSNIFLSECILVKYALNIAYICIYNDQDKKK